jgi:hypothetical protein
MERPKGYRQNLVEGQRACGGRPMTDLAIVAVSAFLILVALIWKAYRVIDERLNEIQSELDELHNGVSHLSSLASKSARTVSENKRKVVDADLAHADLALLRSPGLETDLAVVEDLCAKLITLVPPPEAVPLLSEVPQAGSVLPIPGIIGKKPTQLEGRKLILDWSDWSTLK